MREHTYTPGIVIVDHVDLFNYNKMDVELVKYFYEKLTGAMGIPARFLRPEMVFNGLTFYHTDTMPL